jgi:hypothetical protein
LLIKNAKAHDSVFKKIKTKAEEKRENKNKQITATASFI